MISIILAFLPSFLHVFIRRYFLRDTIGLNTKIKFGTIIFAKNINIGSDTSIGPFTVIKAKELKLGSNCKVSSLSLIKTYSVSFSDYVQIAPFVIVLSPVIKGAELIVGEHSRIFPFCWLEPGEGIEIGSNVGVGGHNLIFTHGVWPNFIEGGPVSFGRVIIEDDVWLPWRVFILPNIIIGKGAIIGANSLINKSIPANALAVGSPAKVIKENCVSELTHDEKVNRINLIIDKFKDYLVRCNKKSDDVKIIFGESPSLCCGDILLLYGNVSDGLIEKSKAINYSIVDLSKNVIHKNHNSDTVNIFISFVRRYGIRLAIIKGH